jgi:hypothetical protein
MQVRRQMRIAASALSLAYAYRMGWEVFVRNTYRERDQWNGGSQRENAEALRGCKRNAATDVTGMTSMTDVREPYSRMR